MRTIENPGVEIREIDLSFYTQLPVGTTVLAVGYAAQGPIDELLNMTSMTELEQVYGMPTNAAERYFYHTCKQVIEANGTLLTTRLPYGSGSGDGYTNTYSALVFPMLPWSNDVDDYTSGVSAVPVEFDSVTTTADDITTPDFVIKSVNFYSQISASLATYSISDVISGSIYYNDTPTLSADLTIVGDITAGYTAAGTGWTGSITPFIIDEYGDVASISLSTSNVGVTSINLELGTLKSGFAPATAGSLPYFTDATNYYIGQPYHVSVTENEYQQWEQGGILWKDSQADVLADGTLFSTLTSATERDSKIGNAGFILVNKAKSAIDEQFAGYYVTIIDNSKTDKGSNYDSILNVKTINSAIEDNAGNWLTLNNDRLGFALSGTWTQNPGSVSETVETIPTWNFANEGKGGFTDSVVLGIFKIRPTVYNQETRVLDKTLYETFVGSFDKTRTIQDQYGRDNVNFYIEDLVNTNSNLMHMFVNPYISDPTRNSRLWWDPVTGDPLKKVRVMSTARTNTGTTQSDILSVNPAEPPAKARIVFDSVTASDWMSEASSMYGVGDYVPCNATDQKYIGNLPLKLERAVRLAENYELIRVDIVPEGGLGTVWTGMTLDMANWPSGATNNITFDRIAEVFDDTRYINGILNAHTFDRDSDGLLSQANGSASEASDTYETIFNIFLQFCAQTRKDCLYVADPLRYIFVQGLGNMKVLDNKTLNYSQHIYWPIKNLFGAANSSYACTYANWLKVNDAASDNLVWLPPSGWLANLMIKTDTNFYPWYAPAGLTRGILTGVVDIAVNPTNKQRDLLYKIGINPIVYWPGEGYIVWGQKTLQQKPSAFDRINVRRLFLWLEKAVLPLARYFVFEQNTVFTRKRFVNAVDPVLAFAKNNEGVYDYLIVCDQRNNTPDVIDRNELIMDIYIKPVKVAEFLLINFIATRTGQDFQELI